MTPGSDTGRRGKRRLEIVAGALAAMAAIVLIVWPSRPGQGAAAPPGIIAPDVTKIDPKDLMPQLAELPAGTTIQSDSYITTVQSSQRNHVSLAVLQRTGREIGFDRDFSIPQYGIIQVEVVRFKTHAGMSAAYKYFLTLPASQGLTGSPFPGVGERAQLVNAQVAAFVEFIRGRYYAVITTIPASKAALLYLNALAHRLDSRIQHYGTSA